MSSILNIAGSLFVSMAEAGNCLTVFVALAIILFCVSLKTDHFFEATLATIYFICGLFYVTKTKLESSVKNTDCATSALIPDFVRRRRILRLDGAEISKQANLTGSCGKEFGFQKEPAVQPGLSRKNCKKTKKKKSFAKSKFKMDDSNDSSSPKADTTHKRDGPEKTKVYSPLQAYLELDLEPQDLYREFKPYVLSREQLRLYEFPLESLIPGKVMVNSKYRKLTPSRSCCRCGSTFSIHSDGRYESGTVCRYHPSKMPSYRGNMEAATYTCCNGNYISEGCVQSQYHVTAESFLKDTDFVKTREKKHLSAKKSCTIYALDCEMLYTTNGFEVAKVGIVGADGLTLYETFVLPEREVLCYNTTYSGVSANDLKSVTTTLRDVQAYLLKLINKDTILVGHALENDLRALRLIHENIVDTSVAFPHSRGVRYKRSLKSLSSEFLSRTIQEGSNGHDCIEDARSCMELMLCKVQQEIQNRPAVLVDENENSVLENVPPSSQPDMVYFPLISNGYPFYYDESYQFPSFYPDQNCRRNSMQRPYFQDPAYLASTKCYAYS